MSLTAVDAYIIASKNIDQQLAAVAKTPEVKRETDYYLANIGKVKSIDDFMKDKRLVTYAMTAYGLGDLSYATAFVRKLLEGGVDDPKAMANQLADARYTAFVKTFNFVDYGSATTAFDAVQKGDRRPLREANAGKERRQRERRCATRPFISSARRRTSKAL